MKKSMKKILAVLLAVALIIPGVYFGESDKQEVKAASNVPTDMLDVKLQIAKNGTNDIRFVSSVDSLHYSSVGFELVTPEKTISCVQRTVYEKIASSVTGLEYEFSPKLVDSTSEYFFTAKYTATENVEYKVRAFVTTLDKPNERVYGQTRSVSLGDDASDTINMMVDFETTEGATYDVYRGETKVGTAKVIEDKNVRITLVEYTSTGFPSATVFTFKNGTTDVGTTIYRNYYTKYTGEGTEDTSWYEVNQDANEFVVASSADLYGLAKLVNGGTDDFSGDTIIQVRNIEVNKGEVVGSTWTASDNETKHEWTQIGTSANMFRGTFDGDSNTISGVVDEDTTFESVSVSSGLFGYTAYGSLISNLKIKNSKFEFNYINSGAVVGDCKGSLENIYVDEDVYVKSLCNDDDNVGGIVGRYLDACDGSQANEIKNCWFAGTVEGKAYVGGIVGRALQGKLTLDNCLLTGTVISTSRMGGIVGDANGNNPNKMNLTIKNSISAGTIDTTEPLAAGTVIGMPMLDSNITIENVYSNEDKIGAATGIGYLGNASPTLTINGLPMKFTDNLNGAKAYSNTELDFWSEDNEDGVWLAIEGSTPVLRVGANVNSAIQNLSGKRYSTGWYNNAYTCTENTMKLPDAATFELDSAADLNGFEVYCNNVTNFTGKTIKLTKDIHLNEGWVPSVNENGTLTNNTGLNQWSPIGKNGAVNTQFNGTFDGQGHSIHGVYVNATTRDAGFFGYTGTAAQIKNLQMYDSYINTNGNSFAGSIVGSFFGSLIENIYVDESVTIFGADAVGGICGAFFAGAPGTTRTVSKCWFDGKAYASKSILGGIVGYIVGGTNTISDCLVTGAVTSTVAAGSKASAGGLIGENIIEGTNLTDCLNIGTIYVNSTTQVDSVCALQNNGITFDDIYTTNDILCKTDLAHTFNVTVGTLVSREEIEADARAELSNLYNKTETVWALDTEGMPILNILQ